MQLYQYEYFIISWKFYYDIWLSVWAITSSSMSCIQFFFCAGNNYTNEKEGLCSNFILRIGLLVMLIIHIILHVVFKISTNITETDVRSNKYWHTRSAMQFELLLIFWIWRTSLTVMKNHFLATLAIAGNIFVFIIIKGFLRILF